MTPLETILVVIAMAGVTFGTRIGGILIMGRIPFSPRVEAFLRYISGSVLVAVVVPPVIRTGPAAWVAVAATLAAMLLTRKPLLALVIGMATAALWRAFMA